VGTQTSSVEESESEVGGGGRGERRAESDAELAGGTAHKQSSSQPLDLMARTNKAARFEARLQPASS
jgi:hypothetical protein